MVISKIEIFKSPIKLKKPFVISLGEMKYADNIIVKIYTNSGLEGIGECSPFLPINGESMETCFVVGQYLAKVLKGKNPLDLGQCTVQMDKTIYGNTSIKSAFDIALYDIAAQAANLPLYKFLGAEKKRELKTDYTVSIGDADEMAADALEIKERGFEVIKVKLGKNGQEDVKRIQAIRASIGLTIPLRLDANQGWSVPEAIETLEALAPYNIQHCEEPIPRWEFMALPKIKKVSPITIMADESCLDHHDAERLIGLDACDAINIKLGKSSGLYKAIKIIKLAEEANIALQIGGFLESRIGFTASAHLAMTSSQVKFIDFDTPLMFEEDPVLEGITYGKNGLVSLSDKIGLGVKVKADYLEKLTKVVI
ncbi:dipeptide epimerase [Arcticibacterium luteifluviistationis]|uniref:Dipeptide epimerase n=2 Tax=Arcticibacterium luteifluviistationis TaxID=1784714 RepID=A0A2Z4GIT6_9BACT|nr:dipeptide epimerase [Arcticibacterium luteifluviistationis]